MLDKRATVGRGGAIHPQYLAHLIDQYAADDAVFTADGGSPMVWAVASRRAPRDGGGPSSVSLMEPWPTPCRKRWAPRRPRRTGRSYR